MQCVMCNVQCPTEKLLIYSEDRDSNYVKKLCVKDIVFCYRLCRIHNCTEEILLPNNCTLLIAHY